MVTFAFNSAAFQASTSLALASGAQATLLTDDATAPLVGSGSDGLLDLAGPTANDDAYRAGAPAMLQLVETGETAAVTEPVVSISPLRAGLATFIGTTVAATPALADTGIQVSLGFSANAADILIVGALFAIPLARLAVRSVRGLVNLVRRTPEVESEAEGTELAAAPAVEETGPTPMVEPPAPTRGERVNQALGRYEAWVAPLRDAIAPWVGAGWLLLDPLRAVPFGYLAPAILIGMGIYNRRYRVRTVDRTLMGNVQDQPVTSQAWDQTRENALGPLGRDVPEEFPTHARYQVNQPRFAGEAEVNETGPRSALYDTLRYALFVVHQVRDEEGYLRFWLGQVLPFAILGKLLKPSEVMAEQGTAVLRQWAIQHAERQRTNITVSGQERLSEIPEGAQVFWAGVHHDALWPNYYGAFLLEREGQFQDVRPVADYQNYYKGLKARLLAPFPVALAKLGLFFVPRQGSNGFDWVKDMRRKTDLGLQPIIYPQGGRAPRVYLEDGTPDEPGLYTNVSSTSHPEYYLKPGIARQATQIASESGEAVYIPILRMSGGHAIDPKRNRNVTKPLPVTSNQTMDFRVAEVIRVDPVPADEVEARSTEVFAEMTVALEQATNANAMIEQRVADWRDSLGYGATELHTVFNERAAEDVRYYIVADRIRAIPPSDEERQRYQRTLFVLLSREHDDAGLQALLDTVSRKVKEVEYN